MAAGTRTRRPADIVAALPERGGPVRAVAQREPVPAAARSAVGAGESIDAANRYPEFLPAAAAPADRGPDRGATTTRWCSARARPGWSMQVLHAVTRPGDRIVLTSPTFDGYPIFAQMARLTPVTVPLDQHGHQDLDAMAEAAADAKVVVLCRPHNPTGTLESALDVERFLRRIPTDTIVLLDEAYVEFVAPQYRIDGPDWSRRFPNVVVLRTFSKAYGLAGLRIGYGFGAPELAATAVDHAAAVRHEHRQCWLPSPPRTTPKRNLPQRIRRIVAERNHLRLRLMAMGVYSTDAHANFVYLPMPHRPWREVFDQAGLQVRRYPDGGARITVGEPPSTLAVLSAVEKSRSPRVAQRAACGMKGRGPIPIRQARPDRPGARQLGTRRLG